jgi:uncharacterized protein
MSEATVWDGYTSFPGWGGRLEILTPDECRRLLDSSQVGRLGYCTDFGPRIVPMNYTLVGDTLIFRTGASTEAARHVPSHAVAFEVDQLDASSETGWSVLVLGNARLLDYASLRMLDLRQTPRPWPEGQRPLILQLPLSSMTGRRVHRA